MAVPQLPAQGPERPNSITIDDIKFSATEDEFMREFTFRALLAFSFEAKIDHFALKMMNPRNEIFARILREMSENILWRIYGKVREDARKAYVFTRRNIGPMVNYAEMEEVFKPLLDAGKEIRPKEV